MDNAARFHPLTARGRGADVALADGAGRGPCARRWVGVRAGGSGAGAEGLVADVRGVGALGSLRVRSRFAYVGLGEEEDIVVAGHHGSEKQLPLKFHLCKCM